MEGSFFTIVAKIVTKLFLALVSVYAPAEKDAPTIEPVKTEVIVECVILDQPVDGAETLFIKMNESELPVDLAFASGYIILKSDNKSSNIKEVHTRVISKIDDEINEGKANIPIIIKKV